MTPVDWEKCEKCGKSVHRSQIAVEIKDGAPIDDPAGFMWCHACHCQRIIDGKDQQIEALQRQRPSIKEYHELAQALEAKNTAEVRARTFVDRCREIRHGSPNAFYMLVDAFCKEVDATGGSR